MAVYKADILDIELNTGNIARSFLCHNIGKDDTKADRFGVRVYRDGEPESLSGCSIQGYMMRPNGTNLAITGSNTGVSGNEAWVDLPQAAYDYEGQFCLALKLIGGGVTGTVRIIDGMINNTFVSDAVAPTAAVPTYQEILAVYDQMVAAKNGSVRFDQSQSLTETQKSVARMNIDAASESDVSDLKSAFEPTRNLWIWGDQTVPANGTATQVGIYGVNIPAGTYTLSALVERTGSANCRMVFYKDSISTANMLANPYIAANSRNSVTFTLADQATIIAIYSGPNASSNVTSTWKNIQLEAGSVATDYVKPYSATDVEARNGCAEILGKLGNYATLSSADTTAIPDGTNYDDLTVGNYACTTAAHAGTMTHAPANVAHRLFVISTHKATYIMQIALISTGSSFTIKARVKTDQNAWYPSNGEWITFTTDKNLSSIIDTTLAVSGKAADSKTTGDAINALPQFRQYLNDNSGITAIADILTTPGWYGWGSAYASSITDLPSNFGNSAGGVEIITPVYANSTFTVSLLYDNKGNVWKRNWKNTTGEPTSDWILEYGPMTEKSDPAYYSWAGKKVAIIGNSISTNDDYDPENNPYGNVPEIYIQQEDIGHTLSAYVTFWDVWADTSKTSGTGLTLKIGGTRRALTDDDIGTEITFVPEAQDVGHMVGKPVSYYRKSYGIKVWWDIAAESLGFTPIPVCWSGSSMTSHENGKALYKTAHAWHDATIRKCGIRIPGGMTRTAPDVIIIYRVANDMTHDTSGIYRVRPKVASGDLWDYPGTYPETDVAGTTGNYTFGFEEATLLTVKKLREAYPKAIIMLATDVTIKRVMFDEFPTRNGINTLPQYNKVIREVADYLGCHLIEFDKNGVTFENLEDYTRDQADPSHPTTGSGPTHPNAKGQRIMANRALIDMKKINAFEI